MAQGARESDDPVAAEPGAIRAEMAKTRATLRRKLGVLKGRVFGTPARKGGKGTMAQRKEKAAGGGKKTTKSKKSSSSRSSKTGSKTKKVLGEMLAGAAVGAVKGAAETVAPNPDQEAQEQKSGR